MKTIIHFMGMKSTKYGGLERFLVELFKQSHESCRSIIVYDEYPVSKEYIIALATYSVEIIVLKRSSFGFVSELVSYCKIIKKYRPDVVHFHFSPLHFIGALIARCFGIPKVYKTQHSCITRGGIQVKSFSQLSIKQRVLSLFGVGVKCYTKIFFVSKYTYEQFINIFGPSDKYMQIYLGIKKINSPKVLQKCDLDIPETEVVLSSILFSNPIKGADILIKALKYTENCVLLLIGLDDNSPYTDMLVNLAHDYGVFHKIRWIGIVDDVSPYLKVSDIYIQPSRTEALSLAACEALSFGKPVVGSNVGGLPEVSTILFENENYSDLARCINSLINHFDYTSLSKDAILKFSENFNIEQSVKRYITEYNDC